MTSKQLAVVIGAVLAGLWLMRGDAPAPAPAPAPNVSPYPPPCPTPPKPRPWGPSRIAPVGASVGGNVAPNGVEVQIDLPGSLHLLNTGGRDGSGLCVFCSIAHSARWQNVPVLEDFRDWMKKNPGGGYPSKVDKMIRQVCVERGQLIPPYLQIESTDLEPLVKACRTGRMPAVTYSYSPTGRYGGGRISHMVSLVHADPERDLWGILDNNYPRTIEWMNTVEFRRTYNAGGKGWAVVLLACGPPPVPRNAGLGFDADAVNAALDAWLADLNPPTPLLGVSGWSPGHEWSVNGEPVSREDVLRALEIPDDGRRPRLTVVGDAATRQAYATAAPPGYLVQTYPPGHVMLEPFKLTVDARFRGFVAIVQDASGRVLQSVYDPREAVRSPDPAYDPNAVKGAGDLEKQLKELANKLPPWVWAAGVVVVVLLWKQEK